VGGITRVDHEGSGSALAEPEAWGRVRTGGECSFATADPAGDIDTDVDLSGRMFVEREQAVEAGDGMNFGGRNVEAFGDVVDRGWADPARPIVHGMEHGEEVATSRAMVVAAPRRVCMLFGCNTEHGVNRCPLVVGRGNTPRGDLH